MIMEKVSSKSYIDLHKLLFHKRVHFTSDCEFFPNFNVNVYVYDINIRNDEIIFETKNISNGKKLTIGSNMKNLEFEII